MRASLFVVFLASCTPLAPFASLAVGDDVSCALAAHRVVCWGDGEPAPQTQLLAFPAAELVIGSSMRCYREETSTGCLLDSGPDAELPDSDMGCSAARMDAGPVDAGPVMTSQRWRCWGDNSRGQFGQSLPDRSTDPVLVPFAGDTLKIARFGGAFACGLRAGVVTCWGAADRGQLGPSGLTDTFIPQQIPLPGTAIALDIGRDHACAATREGVWCWGAGTEGQLGNLDAEDASQPHAVPIGAELSTALGTGIVTLALGARHSCIQVGSMVECWGADELGQLGQRVRSSPLGVYVVNADAVNGLRAGANHTCALNGPLVQCWGDNSSGQLGSSAPMPPGTVTVSVDGSGGVGLGSTHSCALAAGRVYCWGSASQGQLGPGTPVETSVPAAVDSLR